MNDSVGSLFSVSPSGGLVVISGTGSISQRIVAGSEARTSRVGGWGHMFSDEGSAYYIASKAVQLAYRWKFGLHTRLDRLVPDATVALGVIDEYFQLEKSEDILGVFYRKFDKAYIAGLTRHLATGELPALRCPPFLSFVSSPP